MTTASGGTTNLRDEQRLGERAVDRGWITRAQLQEALYAQAEMGKLGLPEQLGTILYKKKLITQDQLQELVREDSGAGVRRLGNFEVGEKIGQGAMGVVFKARQISMDRTLALKILSPKFASDSIYIQRFIQEARTADKLNHINIVSAVDVGFSDPYYYFAMEYVEGVTLRKVLEERGYLSEPEVLEIAAQVARALEHALTRKIIHRDIKPDNIMRAKSGVVKVLDLGLAVAAGAGSTEEAGASQEERKAVGTPHYMSPEAARGESDLDTRADLYSLGCTLYHLLTGSTPFEGTRGREVMIKHLTDPIPDARKRRPEVSSATARLVAKMMAKNRGDRYESPSQLIEDLEAILAGEAPPNLVHGSAATGPRISIRAGRSTGPRPPVSTRSARTRLSGGLAASILFGAILVVAGAMALSRSETTPASGEAPSTAPSSKMPASTSAPAPPVASPAPAASPAPSEVGAPAKAAAPLGPPGAQKGIGGGSVQAMLAAAAQIRTQKPDDFPAILKAYDNAARAALGTVDEAEAKGLYETARGQYDSALQAALEKLRRQSEELALKGQFISVDEVLADEAFPENLRVGNWELELQKVRSGVGQSAEVQAQKRMTLARAQAQKGTQAGYTAAIATAKEVEKIPADLSSTAAGAAQERAAWEALRDKLSQQEGQALAQQTELAKSQWALARKDLTPHLRAARFTKAQQLLEQELHDPVFSTVREPLKALHAQVESVLMLRQNALDALRSRVGETVTIKQTRDSIVGVVSEKQDTNGITLKCQGNATVPFFADQIMPEDIDTHAPKLSGKEEAEDLKRRGLLFLFTGDLDRAKFYFSLARDRGLGAQATPLLQAVEAARAEETEIRAKEAWDAAETHFNAKRMKEALKAYQDFTAKFGKSQLAEAKKDELGERLNAINANLNPFRPDLLAEYFKGIDLNVQARQIRRADHQIDFDWGNGSPDPKIPGDRFSVRWTGALKVALGGHYTLAIESDDGIRLWLDGKKIIENWTDHPPRRDSINLDLVPGFHDLKLEYYEQGGGASCRLFWALKDQFAEQPIPAQALGHMAAQEGPPAP